MHSFINNLFELIVYPHTNFSESWNMHDKILLFLRVVIKGRNYVLAVVTENTYYIFIVFYCTRNGKINYCHNGICICKSLILKFFKM